MRNKKSTLKKTEKAHEYIVPAPRERKKERKGVGKEGRQKKGKPTERKGTKRQEEVYQEMGRSVKSEIKRQ